MLRKHPLVAYVLLAYGWTWLTILPLLLQRRGWTDTALPNAWEAVGAFGPFLGAVAVLWGAGGLRPFLRSLGRWRIGTGWWLFALLGPFGFLGVALLVTGSAVAPIAGLAGHWSAAGLVDLVLVGALLQSVGEEPGWRGYLLPALRERKGPALATLMLVPVWIFWHLPFFLSRPEFGVAQFAGFSLGILSAAVWLTLLWEGTRSLLIAIVWHTLLNITRGIALAISTRTFLAYGLTVLAGAVVIGLWYVTTTALIGQVEITKTHQQLSHTQKKLRTK